MFDMAKVLLENSMYTTRFVTPDTVLASQRVTDYIVVRTGYQLHPEHFCILFQRNLLDFWINVMKMQKFMKNACNLIRIPIILINNSES